jgi:hypothetical protein
LFAYRIPPDVGRDPFNGIGWTEHIIVIAFLPKTSAKDFLERKSGLLFELPNKFKEIRVFRCALREQMQVIGHGAVGMK